MYLEKEKIRIKTIMINITQKLLNFIMDIIHGISLTNYNKDKEIDEMFYLNSKEAIKVKLINLLNSQHKINTL